MLVCNVSLRPPRLAIAATIAEAVAASDATATGNVVFATLVDDPASVSDTVDAYSGEIMLEAASAAEAAEAGLIYVTGLDEEATITDAWDGAVPAIYTDAVAEIASASDAPNATVVIGGAVTTISSTFVGPLFSMDTTFTIPLVTVINPEKVD